MSDDILTSADSRVLHGPLVEHLENDGPRATLDWLVGVLTTQPPGLRSSNAALVAYTGCPEALDWLEATVQSPVTETWGSAAALLGVSWPRIVCWLEGSAPRQLMALDAIVAYRAPAPNMAPLAQIAAPALSDPPSLEALEASLAAVVLRRSTPRVRKAIERIRFHAHEILTRQHRGVAVADLARLYLDPESFPGAGPILERHDAINAHVQQSIQDLISRKAEE